MGSQPKPKPMYVYDIDDTGRPIVGTKKSAKQRPVKVTREISERIEVPQEKRKSKSDTGPKYDSVSEAKLVAMLENTKLERRKSSASSKSPSKRTPSRPPSAHGNKSFPPLIIPTDQPSHFGITTAPAASQYAYPPVQARPRAITTQTYPSSRPQSFHAAYTSAGYGTGPPISASAYYQPPLIAPSYPPPSPSSSFMRYAAQPEYYAPASVNSRSLSSRFDSPIQRTSSALAMREDLHHIQDYYEDTGYASASEAPVARRRSSIRVPSGKTRVRSQQEIDYEAMPPPPVKPGILRNRSTEYYQDVAPDPSRSSRLIHHDDPPPRRPSTNRHSVSYELPSQVRVETANTSHRRKSYYGQSESTNSGSGSGSGTTAYEEKLRKAAGYQEDVGGPTTPLSAESLKRLHRRQAAAAAAAAGSSRSTKSSESQEDESDYRRSATTHTSQSGRIGDDDFTIKVKGAPARIMVGSAQIDCADGGEVEIKRNKSIRGGSERSSSVYGDDRRSRVERLPGRSRMSSHSGRSYDRPTPIQYAPRADYF